MRPTRRLFALGLAALTVVGASLPAAAAVDVVPVTFHLKGLRPGEQRSHDVTVHVHDAATVTSVELRSDGAPTLAWAARLCDGAGACRALDGALVGHVMTPGTWVITVTATAADTLQPGDRSQVAGRVVVQGGDVAWDDGAAGDGAPRDADDVAPGARDLLAGRTDPLALTGVPLPVWLALAVAVTATGAWLVVLARQEGVPT